MSRHSLRRIIEAYQLTSAKAAENSQQECPETPAKLPVQPGHCWLNDQYEYTIPSFGQKGTRGGKNPCRGAMFPNGKQNYCSIVGAVAFPKGVCRVYLLGKQKEG